VSGRGSIKGTKTSKIMVDRVLSLMSKYDSEIDDLFEKVEKLADQLENEPKKLEKMLETEYLLFRLQIKVSKERSIIHRIVTVYNKEQTIRHLIGTFKNRMSYLAEVIQRINEIKSIMDLIQRTTYLVNSKI